MLIRDQHSSRSTWLILGAVVALTILCACIVVVAGLSFRSLPDWILAESDPATPTAPLHVEGETVVAVLDVGQGQAVLVLAPDGSAALIDAGRSQTRIRESIQPFLDSLGVTRLDYLILSHPDQDHVGGMPEILESLVIDTWVDPGIPTTNQRYEETIRIILERDIPAIQAQRGGELRLGDDVRLSILWPDQEFIFAGDQPDSNENSAVIKVSVGTVGVLIPGDLEQRGERMLVQQDDGALKSQVLVVGHHGSNTSSTPEFLNAVDPDIAIISAGADNPYGHPHDEVLQRFRFRATTLYRTDTDGTIIVTTDGQEVSVATVETSSE